MNKDRLIILLIALTITIFGVYSYKLRVATNNYILMETKYSEHIHRLEYVWSKKTHEVVKYYNKRRYAR